MNSRLDRNREATPNLFWIKSFVLLAGIFLVLLHALGYLTKFSTGNWLLAVIAIAFIWLKLINDKRNENYKNSPPSKN